MELQAEQRETAISALRLQPIVVPMTNFAPEPFRLREPVWAVVQAVDDAFVATYFDANISTSGDTQEEAVANLKDLILDIYLDLDEEPVERLGPEPKRQLAVLRSVIRQG